MNPELWNGLGGRLFAPVILLGCCFVVLIADGVWMLWIIYESAREEHQYRRQHNQHNRKSSDNFSESSNPATGNLGIFGKTDVEGGSGEVVPMGLCGRDAVDKHLNVSGLSGGEKVTNCHMGRPVARSIDKVAGFLRRYKHGGDVKPNGRTEPRPA